MTLPNQPKPTICPICGKPTKGMPFHTCCRTQEPESAAAPDGLKALRERVNELEKMLFENGHDEICYICKEKCNSLAAFPGVWPVAISYADEPGIVRWHHTACVGKHLTKLKAASEVIEECEKGLQMYGRRGAWFECISQGNIGEHIHDGEPFMAFEDGQDRPWHDAKQAIAAIKEWKARP